MSSSQTLFQTLSDALAAQTALAGASVAAIQVSDARHITGTIWKDEIVITSEQVLPQRDSFDVMLPAGESVTAALVGRDAATNIAVLRLSRSKPHASSPESDPKPGSFVFAFGADGAGAASVRLGVVNLAGPAWHSRRGGRIDRRIVLDLHLARREEGGPVFDSSGAILGFSTFGPRRQVLVIPAATVNRILPLILKDGRVPRGWLGAALQPVSIPDALQAAAGQASGMMVMSVADDGPSAKAGVLPGDILISVGGEAARRFRRIAAMLGPDSVGQERELKLIRGGAVTTVKATITPRPET